MIDTLFGVTVQVSPALPIVPSDGENARRIVRHGLADVLRWLKQDVGPKPGEEAHSFLLPDDGVLLVSSGFKTRLMQSMNPITGAIDPGTVMHLQAAFDQRHLALMKGYRL